MSVCNLASVERVFSLMNNLCTNNRDRLSHDTLTALMMLCREKDGQTHLTKVYIERFVVMSAVFYSLSTCTSSVAFCKVLEGIMRANTLHFYLAGEPFSSTPAVGKSGRAKKKKYVCPYSFSEQVDMFRNLHPDSESFEDLTTKDKGWRVRCMRAMGFEGTLTEFGGFFKEAITVSCLKTQSYIVAVKIMKDRTISGQKVNRNCFASLPGVQEKERIFPILQRWALGQIDRKGANKEWEETKKTQVKSQTARASNEQLRKRNQTLEQENSRLKNQLELLRKELDSALNKRKEDVFEFETLDQDIVPQITTKKRRAAYKVSFEMSSEPETDDSLIDPHWKPSPKNSSSSMDCEGAGHYSSFDPLFCGGEKLEIQEAEQKTDRQSGTASMSNYVQEEQTLSAALPMQSSASKKRKEPETMQAKKKARNDQGKPTPTLSMKVEQTLSAGPTALGKSSIKKNKSYMRTGDKVVAKKRGGKGNWVPAVITAKLKGGSIVQVKFNDDGALMFVPQHDIHLVI